MNAQTMSKFKAMTGSETVEPLAMLIICENRAQRAKTPAEASEWFRLALDISAQANTPSVKPEAKTA